MATEIKYGEPVFIPFRNGTSILDSQNKPRIYKTQEAFEKHFPWHYAGTDVMLVEYVPIVRCKDCQYRTEMGNCCHPCNHDLLPTVYSYDFCNYGQRKPENAKSETEVERG